MNLSAGHMSTQTAGILMMLAVALCACRKEAVPEGMLYAQPREQMPALSTKDVSTLISDSRDTAMGVL